MVGVSLVSTGEATAQSFRAVHTFGAVSGPNATNTDGANPYGGLILSGSTLYGTATYGGGSGWGIVFALDANGTSFAALHHFTGGSDGANPYAELFLTNSVLYGTASAGGGFGAGTVFSVDTNGLGFAVLHSFTVPVNNSFGFYTNSDGADPVAGLILWGDIIYGAGNIGGTSGRGTLFSVGTDGLGFNTLHSFSSGTGAAYSSAGLILVGGSLYGTDYANLGNGTVFAIDSDGTGFTNYYGFSVGHLNGNGVLTNMDGANPRANLVLAGNTLYGTAENGGSAGNGTVFAINTDGTGFTTLHHFEAGAYSSGLYTNRDGIHPSAGLILSGHSLYGTASGGGKWGNGTVFVINTNGTGFEPLYHFTATPPYPAAQTNSDGANPSAGLVLSGNTLYGTTPYGGVTGNGTVFSLKFAPQLTISVSGADIVLTWPTNAAGFDYSAFVLQSATEVTGPFTNVTGATTPYTNAMAGSQQFFRLSE